MARCVYCSPFQVADLEEGTSSRRLTVSWETSYGYDPMLSASFLSLFFFFSFMDKRVFGRRPSLFPASDYTVQYSRHMETLLAHSARSISGLCYSSILDWWRRTVVYTHRKRGVSAHGYTILRSREYVRSESRMIHDVDLCSHKELLISKC